MKRLNKDILSYLKWCAEKFLSYRPRSEFEVAQYLRRKMKIKHPEALEEQDDYIKETIEYYKETSGINDEEFVNWWVQERSYFKPKGERALRQELRQKGVAQELVDQTLAAHQPNESELLKQLVNQKAQLSDLSSKKGVEKLTQHLLRRGFSYNEIKKAIADFKNVE